MSKWLWRMKKDRQKAFGFKDEVEMYSGINDVNGTPIFEDDHVRGLFYHNDSIVGVCAFKDGSFGIKWMRGDVEEFTPFTSTWNVQWECESDAEEIKEEVK